MKSILLALALFHQGDTVMQTRSHQVYVIDSLMVRPRSKQIFYHAHDLSGVAWNWLPEIMIKKTGK